MSLWQVYPCLFLLVLQVFSNEAKDCSCNGVTDANDLGQCTKKEVWCYVDPQASCFDVEIWTGAFGSGWSYSHQACEAQLELEHQDECEEQKQFETTAVGNKTKECSCNGNMEANGGGECKKKFVGELWCYVDRNSGCEDTTVWHGEYGFCKTYSYQACGASSPYIDTSDVDDTHENGDNNANSVSLENIIHSTNAEEGCVCNGVTDANKHGLCTKQSVWCYIDPQNTCSDAMVWTGVYGYGWTYSYQACDQQLALEHRDECKRQISSQTDAMSNKVKECTCNGKVDCNDDGEWVGKLWCYVDFNSGCQDSAVWYGEHGFCEVYSYQACGSSNETTVAVLEDTNTAFDSNDNAVEVEITYSSNPVEGCFCNGAIDENNDGHCSKENVWCYVDPQSTCNDSLIWVGVYGLGWSYSFQACEDQLEEEHKDECERLVSTEEDVMTSKSNQGQECSCNGEMDGGGECMKAWVGKLWCYVDKNSGCQDSTVWYGEDGFCQTISYMACNSLNSTASNDVVENNLGNENIDSEKESDSHNFCTSDWLKAKCLYDCQKGDLCTPLVHFQCKKCNFKEENSVLSSYGINAHSFCDKDWLRFKCEYGCQEEDSCTPWVRLQCGKCKAIWKQ